MKRIYTAIAICICMFVLAYPANADTNRDVKHYLELGQMMEFNANLDAAQRAYAKVLSIDPNSLEAHRALARVDAQLGQLDQAAGELKCVIRLTPRDETALLELCELLKKQGKAREAVQLLKSACAYPHEGLKLERELAFTYLEADQPAKAADEFHFLITQQPDVVDNLVGLAMADFRSGNENLAQSDIKKVLQVNPNEPNALCLQADLALSHGAKDEAIGGYLKAIEISPSLSKPYLSLGNLYIDENQVEKARDIFEKGMANCNPDADLLLGMAIVEERSKAADQAIDLYQRAASIEADPARKKEIRQRIKEIKLSLDATKSQSIN